MSRILMAVIVALIALLAVTFVALICILSDVGLKNQDEAFDIEESVESIFSIENFEETHMLPEEYMNKISETIVEYEPSLSTEKTQASVTVL